jgi:hypothetical protein
MTKLFEKTLSQVKPDERFWVWDKSIPTLITDLHHHEQFRHELNVVDTPVTVRTWTTNVNVDTPRRSPTQSLS